MNRSALSRDGYIIDQRCLNLIRYGRCGSHYNGCGWIAAYNLLHCCGIDLSPESVCRALEKSLRFGGKFGTFPCALLKFLRQYLPISLKICGQKKFEKLSHTPGIILYWTGRSAHNVHFSPCGHDTLMLFNAKYGAFNHRLSPVNFWKEYVHFPLALVFTVSDTTAY